MASNDLFTRNEVLSGMPTQRARTALFLIESRTAHLVARSRQAMDWQLSERAVQDQDLAFIEAFAETKDPPLRPSIQDLEHHVAEWADLIPENLGVKAALAHLLGEKYRFTPGMILHICQSLALNDPAVQRAYQRQYREAIEAIYTAHPSAVERLSWAWARLGSSL